MQTTRFVYHERVRKSIWPSLFKVLGVTLFGTSKVIPDSERVNTFEKYLLESDELADKVVMDLFGKDRNHKDSFRLMNKVVEEGISDLDNIPEYLEKLIRQSWEEPEWLDRGKVELGARVCRRLGEHAIIVLGDMALLGGYANPDISKPLVFTGTLMGDKTFDRVSETSQFWVDVTREGALNKGAKGFKSCIRVRMMHALVRQRMMHHPKWNSQAWGLPINKADSLATNVGFSMAMLYGTKRLGYHLPDREMEAVFHLWKYIGYLMGDDADWLPNNAAEGIQSLFLVTLSNNNMPDEETKKLAHDYLKSFKPEAGTKVDLDYLNKYYIYLKHKAYARLLIPFDLYKNLDLKPVYLTWLPLVFLLTPYNFTIDRLRLLFPAIEKRMEREGARLQEKVITDRMGSRQATYIPH